MMATDIDYYRHSQNWLDSVSETGTFVKNIEATWPDSNGVIPEGWRVKTE